MHLLWWTNLRLLQWRLLSLSTSRPGCPPSAMLFYIYITDVSFNCKLLKIPSCINQLIIQLHYQLFVYKQYFNEPNSFNPNSFTNTKNAQQQYSLWKVMKHLLTLSFLYIIFRALQNHMRISSIMREKY